MSEEVCNRLKSMIEIHLDVRPEDKIVKLKEYFVSRVAEKGDDCSIEIDVGTILDEQIEEIEAKLHRTMKRKLDRRSISSTLSKGTFPKVGFEGIVTKKPTKRDPKGPATIENIKISKLNFIGVTQEKPLVPEPAEVVEDITEEIEKVVEQAQKGVVELTEGAAKLLTEFFPERFIEMEEE